MPDAFSRINIGVGTPQRLIDLIESSTQVPISISSQNLRSLLTGQYARVTQTTRVGTCCDRWLLYRSEEARYLRYEGNAFPIVAASWLF